MALENSRQGRAGAVLWPAAGSRVFDTGRLPLPEPLTAVAAYYWWVTWRHERPAPVRQQVLSHPVTHLTVEAAEGGRLHGLPVPAALVHGLVTRVFTVELPVAGRVAGIAFHPGGLAALLGRGVRELTDTVVPASLVFDGGRRAAADGLAGQQLPGSVPPAADPPSAQARPTPPVRALTERVLAEGDESARRDAAAEFLAALLSPCLAAVRADASYWTVRRAVELMGSREHVTLGSVAGALHVSERTLQRLFSYYVGASPLWVLRRQRLQDVVAALDAGEGQDLAALAASLGFADHAHLTRVFTATIGVPPSEYRRAGAG
ncbi:MAG TPA: helix-turn-helix domain-containing protein [Actinomycetaceae bacterium]|nr:helix-turn-helix domain-containing protein [Actinomycetaceae bacterium]